MFGATVSAVSASAVIADTYRTLPLVGKGLGMDSGALMEMFGKIESGLRDMTSSLPTGALDNLPKLPSNDVSKGAEPHHGTAMNAKGESITRS